jgi:hypothetical protein
MLGLLCKKRRQASQAGHRVNYYAKNLESLRQRAVLSSIEDMKFIAKAGLGKIAIVGDEREAGALRRLVE